MEILSYLQVLSLTKPFFLIFEKHCNNTYHENLGITEKKIRKWITHSVITQTKYLFIFGMFCSLLKSAWLFFFLKGNLQFYIFLFKNNTYYIVFTVFHVLPPTHPSQCSFRVLPWKTLPWVVCWDASSPHMGHQWSLLWLPGHSVTYNVLVSIPLPLAFWIARSVRPWTFGS